MPTNFNHHAIPRKNNSTVADSRKQTWIRRNDSNQISTILKPRLYFSYDSETSEDKATVSNQKSEKNVKSDTSSSKVNYPMKFGNVKANKSNKKITKGVPSLQIKNFSKKQIKPKKTLTSNKVYKLPNEKSKTKNDNLPVTESTHSLETLKHVQEIINYSPKSKFLRRLKDEAEQLPVEYKETEDEDFKSKILSDLEFTNRRRLLEKGYRQNDHLNESDHRHCNSPINYNNRQVCDHLKHDNLQDLNNFRKNNYFECHSTTDLIQDENIPEHRCIHKYKINDRLFLEPINADRDDVSRCTICSLPINIPKLYTDENLDDSLDLILNRCEWEYEKRRELLKNKKYLNLFDREIELRIPVDPDNDNLVIKQLRRPKSDPSASSLGKLKMSEPNFKFRPIVPSNSLALRFQKGVV